MISYTVQHVLVLRLLVCYRFASERTLHNLMFLVSAAKTDQLELGFYDFVRTRRGAYSRRLHRILRELQQERLVIGDGLAINERGRRIYTNLAACLKPFNSIWELCTDIVESHGGDAENLNKRVFDHLAFRRVKPGEHIFYP